MTISSISLIHTDPAPAKSGRRVQLRGHCPMCGKFQAVKQGKMSQHGYEVKGETGWAHFVGVCPGHRYAPIEHDRAPVDAVVKTVREDAAGVDRLVASLQSGEKTPAQAKSGRLTRDDKGRQQYELVPYADAPKWHQQDALKSAIFGAEQQARAMRGWADMMERLANECHGQPLQEVNLDAKPAAIVAGEQRQTKPGSPVLTFKHADGPRAYYTYDSDGKVRTSWMALRSWRLLPTA